MTAHMTGDGQDRPAERSRTTPPPGQDINPLQQLIRQRLSERGWPCGQVARRGSLPRSTVCTWPRPGT